MRRPKSSKCLNDMARARVSMRSRNPAGLSKDQITTMGREVTGKLLMG
jgi:hypothetical protein